MSCPGKVIKYIYFKIHVWTFLDFGNQRKRDWSSEFLTFFDAAAQTSRESCGFPSWRSANLEASLATPLARLVAHDGWGRGNKNIARSCTLATPTTTCFRQGRGQSKFASFGGLLSKNESGDAN